MNHSRLTVILLAVAACLTTFATDANAQRRGRSGGGHAVGRAVPRPFVHGGGRPIVVSPRRYVSPRVIGVAPYRPYYYGYRPGLTLGFYAGFGYPYGYAYGYGAYGGYANGYGGYGSPYGYGYPYRYRHAYPYPYSSSVYPYGAYNYALPPPAYVSAAPGYAYGGVRIQDAPLDAQVFVDGYYVGVVDDFDGSFQHLNLTAGPHNIEIRAAGYQPITFDVNVQPGRTITYRAHIQ
jgi:PEGA domain